MDFRGLHDRLVALQAPGLIGANLPRAKDPADKKDAGRAGDPFLEVEPGAIVELLTLCRDDPALGFELLVDVCGTDRAADDEHLWVGYQLLSVRHKHRLAIKCLVPKADARIPSAAGIYSAARWHEREAAEMYGLTFEGHPDPRHILLPDDWAGYPLRKDYEFPKEYHGISCE